jgi:GNAT superfamily N-acetyltransferase
MDAHHPEEPHYYLFAIGTHRNARGKGVGSTLMQAMVDRSDDEGVPAYLENSKPRNEAFYARHGFVAGDLLPMPSGCPAVQPMWRTPR